MDATYISLIIFIVVTVIYYMFKPKQSIEMIEDTSDKLLSDFTKSGYMYLIIYFLIIVVSQFFINASVLVNKCGGSISQNIGASAVMTFIPWVFIFGSLMLVLMIFPGFKSAFSNVVGYFVVAGQANEILANLLVNTDLQNTMEKENVSAEEQKDLQRSAEAIIKICGNISVMINQIVPDNFRSYWKMLTPLMKKQYFGPGGAPTPELMELKEKLLGVVVMRDNIGEALWYIYAAVLLISIIQYKIVSCPCVKTPAQIAEMHQQFLDEEEQAAAVKNKLNSQAYVG